MSLTIPKNAWMPVVTSTVPGDLSVTYTFQRAVWAQADGVVVAGFDIGFTPTYTTAGGIFAITGLPEPPTENFYWGGMIRFISPAITWPTGATQLVTAVTVGSPPPQPPVYLSVFAYGSGVTATSVAITAFTSGTPYRIQGNLTWAVGP